MNTESGAMVSGKWINPHNGMIINVMNTVIDENNQMLIMTDKGTISMSDFSSNFVQCDDETLAAIQPAPKVNSSVNIQTTSPIRAEKIEVITEPTPKAATQQTTDIIDKLFNKIESTPEINIDIKWDDFPTEQVKMLINFLDVKESDISKYLINKYLDQYAILLALDKFLKSKI